MLIIYNYHDHNDLSCFTCLHSLRCSFYGCGAGSSSNSSLIYNSFRVFLFWLRLMLIQIAPNWSFCLRRSVLRAYCNVMIFFLFHCALYFCIQSKPQYAFGYEVDDYYNQLSHGRWEVRDGDVTQGQYRVLLPDGRVQVSCLLLLNQFISPSPFASYSLLIISSSSNSQQSTHNL